MRGPIEGRVGVALAGENPEDPAAAANPKQAAMAARSARIPRGLAREGAGGGSAPATRR